MGSPQHANTLSRFGSAAMRSSRPEVRAARNDNCANKKSATACSRFVVDSISTRARVSSKRFMRTNYFWREQNERKEPRKKYSRLLPLDSAPSGFSTGGKAAI